jgi:EpsI family protein
MKALSARFMPGRTSAFLGALMVGTSIFANVARPKRLLADICHRAPLSEELPKQLQRWKKLQVEIQPVIDPTQQAVLKYLYTETVTANYINASDSVVMLSLAYGKDQSDGHDIHKPDLCYPAQGFSIVEQSQIPLVLDAHRNFPVQYMMARKNERVEPMIYWTTAGNFTYRNKFEKKVIGFKYSRDDLIPDGMILRASMLENNSKVALDLLYDFVKDWYESMPEKQRGRYFGEAIP